MSRQSVILSKLTNDPVELEIDPSKPDEGTDCVLFPILK